MIAALAAAVTGPRGRWVTIAVWIALAIGGYVGRSHLGSVSAAGQSSFLPKGAESIQALEVLDGSGSSSPNTGGEGREEVPAVVVFDRQGGLTDDDLNAIGKIGHGLNELKITGATPIVDPFSASARRPLGDVAKLDRGIGPISNDGEAALVVLALNADDHGAIRDGVTEIREYLAAHAVPGLSAYVTGPAGIAADLDQVANEAGETLLLATLGLVLVLLLLVYRAPLLALLPLIAVGAAYMVAIGIAYLLIKGGWIVVNTEGTFLLLVLVFGAGTDYSLLLVHRYREEIQRGRPAAEALPLALRQTIPAVGASGGTVIAAMLVLLVADLQSTHWLGPILAIGIAVMVCSAFTLLPALLAVLGERAFWPAAGVPRQGPGIWDRVASLVERRSRPIIALVTGGLVVLALGNFLHHGTIGFGQGETKPTNSSEGTAVLNEHFPPGLASPLTAVVPPDEAAEVTAGMKNLASVRLAIPVPAGSGFESAAVLLVLAGNPYSGEAAEEVEKIRERLHAISPTALLGGLPAENWDVEQTNGRDTRLIVPLVLVVVGLILVAVLQAIAAPLYLILTVVLSFAGTLGLSTFLFSQFGGEGITFDLTLLSFLFLVALGVDYNIFLMTRVREEAARHGTEAGTLRALIATGGVVTGAGLILAGTFATLTLLPLEELIQIGATVAIGVLLDTFIVRALLIPAITFRLGDRAWWPSSSRARPRP
ncbi:MAG: putative drug exporter of the superfamily [Solirubrobacterales bacterium]|nr:putative drug exporter of the superfamily [Solirubrobacterales bacterium]